MMKVVILLIIVFLACCIFSISRGAITSHEIYHDTPSLAAYVIGCIAATTAGFRLGKILKQKGY